MKKVLGTNVGLLDKAFTWCTNGDLSLGDVTATYLRDLMPGVL